MTKQFLYGKIGVGGNIMGTYYDGTKLLSLLDLNGNKPEIFLCTTNRTGGKTTYFSRLLMNRFFNQGEKFCLIYRYKYELSDVADKFYKDIRNLFFPDTLMTAKVRAKGIYCDLYVNDKHCGYAIALNCAEQIKKYSHLFSDVKTMYFDEFQSETNEYCPNEINKFHSVHTSIARGKSEQVRYVPVYMTANPISMINPYYTALGISERLNEKTKFIKGDGFVLEQGYVESASLAQKESGFNRAFSKTAYSAYASEGVYLNDNKAFIEKPEGFPRYIATLKYNGCEYGIREYSELGIVYCDNKADRTFPVRISVTTDDHNINYVMLKRNDLFLANLRYYFERGCFRFKDLKCKEAVLKALSY